MPETDDVHIDTHEAVINLLEILDTIQTDTPISPEQLKSIVIGWDLRGVVNACNDPAISTFQVGVMTAGIPILIKTAKVLNFDAIFMVRDGETSTVTFKRLTNAA